MAHPLGESLAVWSRATDNWMQFYNDLARNVIETNRAAAAAVRLPMGTNDDRSAPAVESLAYRSHDWEFERSVDDRTEIGVDDYVTFSKTLTDADVREFARASGDTNRLHLDDAFAKHSRFGRRIVHGTLVSGLVSAALARLPGLTIYLSQDIQYLGPVEVGERATATCEVVEALGDYRFRLTTTVTNADDEVVVDGEAVVLVDELPDDHREA